MKISGRGGEAPDDDFRLPAFGGTTCDESGCRRRGSVDVINAGLGATTTRSDGKSDTGPVDLGYHYPPESAQ